MDYGLVQSLMPYNTEQFNFSFWTINNFSQAWVILQIQLYILLFLKILKNCFFIPNR